MIVDTIAAATSTTAAAAAAVAAGATGRTSVAAIAATASGAQCANSGLIDVWKSKKAATMPNNKSQSQVYGGNTYESLFPDNTSAWGQLYQPSIAAKMVDKTASNNQMLLSKMKRTSSSPNLRASNSVVGARHPGMNGTGHVGVDGGGVDRGKFVQLKQQLKVLNTKLARMQRQQANIRMAERFTRLLSPNYAVSSLDQASNKPEDDNNDGDGDNTDDDQMVTDITGHVKGTNATDRNDDNKRQRHQSPVGEPKKRPLTGKVDCPNCLCDRKRSVCDTCCAQNDYLSVVKPSNHQEVSSKQSDRPSTTIGRHNKQAQSLSQAQIGDHNSAQQQSETTPTSWVSANRAIGTKKVQLEDSIHDLQDSIYELRRTNDKLDQQRKLVQLYKDHWIHGGAPRPANRLDPNVQRDNKAIMGYEHVKPVIDSNHNLIQQRQQQQLSIDHRLKKSSLGAENQSGAGQHFRADEKDNNNMNESEQNSNKPMPAPRRSKSDLQQSTIRQSARTRTPIGPTFFSTVNLSRRPKTTGGGSSQQSTSTTIKHDLPRSEYSYQTRVRPAQRRSLLANGTQLRKAATTLGGAPSNALLRAQKRLEKATQLLSDDMNQSWQTSNVERELSQFTQMPSIARDLVHNATQEIDRLEAIVAAQQKELDRLMRQSMQQQQEQQTRSIEQQRASTTTEPMAYVEKPKRRLSYTITKDYDISNGKNNNNEQPIDVGDSSGGGGGGSSKQKEQDSPGQRARDALLENTRQQLEETRARLSSTLDRSQQQETNTHKEDQHKAKVLQRKVCDSLKKQHELENENEMLKAALNKCIDTCINDMAETILSFDAHTLPSAVTRGGPGEPANVAPNLVASSNCVKKLKQDLLNSERQRKLLSHELSQQQRRSAQLEDQLKQAQVRLEQYQQECQQLKFAKARLEKMLLTNDTNDNDDGDEDDISSRCDIDISQPEPGTSAAAAAAAAAAQQQQQPERNNNVSSKQSQIKPTTTAKQQHPQLTTTTTRTTSETYKRYLDSIAPDLEAIQRERQSVLREFDEIKQFLSEILRSPNEIYAKQMTKQRLRSTPTMSYNPAFVLDDSPVASNSNVDVTLTSFRLFRPGTAAPEPAPAPAATATDNQQAITNTNNNNNNMVNTSINSISSENNSLICHRDNSDQATTIIAQQTDINNQHNNSDSSHINNDHLKQLELSQTQQQLNNSNNQLVTHQHQHQQQQSWLGRRAAVECRNMRYDVGRGRNLKTILYNINVTVPEGSIYGLLGPSGCGKTTMLRCVVGRIKPKEGHVRVFGYRPNEPGSQIPGPAIGYMPQELSVYEDFTIDETLRYFGKINRMHDSLIDARIEFLINFLDLPHANRLVASLSGGQKRRVSLAAALVHSPPLLILDEPTVGVDPLLRHSIWQHLVTLAKTEKISVIITTHYIEEARQADVVGLMRHGKLLAEDSPENLMQQQGMDNLEEVFLKLCVSDSSRRAAKLANLGLPMGVTTAMSVAPTPEIEPKFGKNIKMNLMTPDVVVQSHDDLANIAALDGAKLTSDKVGRMQLKRKQKFPSIFTMAQLAPTIDSNGKSIVDAGITDADRCNRKLADSMVADNANILCSSYTSTSSSSSSSTSSDQRPSKGSPDHTKQTTTSNLLALTSGDNHSGTITNGARPHQQKSRLQPQSSQQQLERQQQQEQPTSGDFVVNKHHLESMAPGTKYARKKVTLGAWSKSLMAVTWKNYIRLKRNPPVLIFEFLLPAVQVVLFCLCIGGDPFDVPLAVVNDETIPQLSRLFLDSIDKSTIRQVPYPNLPDAIESVRRGDSWGAIHIPDKYTQNLQERLLHPADMTNETLANGTITIYPDLTNLHLALAMENTFREAFTSFAKNSLHTLGYDPSLAELPVKVEKPVYGTMERNGYLEFMAPGVVISITYVMATGLTALAFILEKRDGLLERSLVSGVTTSQILLAHAAIQVFVMIIQISLVLAFVFFVFEIPSKGPFIWVILLILLQGCTGMAFGLLVSAVCQEENTAVMMLVGTFYTNLILAGIIWPIEAMPKWLRWLSYAQPQTLPTETLRNILSRGWGIAETGVLAGFAVTIGWLIVFLLAAASINDWASRLGTDIYEGTTESGCVRTIKDSFLDKGATIENVDATRMHADMSKDINDLMALYRKAVETLAMKAEYFADNHNFSKALRIAFPDAHKIRDSSKLDEAVAVELENLIDRIENVNSFQTDPISGQIIQEQPVMSNEALQIMLNSSALTNDTSTSFAQQPVSQYPAASNGGTPVVGQQEWQTPVSYMPLYRHKAFGDLYVNLDHSAVHVPTHIYPAEPAVMNGIAWTSHLTQVFKTNFGRNHRLINQYFASYLGFTRMYPATKWRYSSEPDLYDARMRPWYVTGSSCPKDVVILVDSSGSMTGSRRDIAKSVVFEILDTLTDNDHFLVLSFSKTVTPIGIPSCSNIKPPKYQPQISSQYMVTPGQLSSHTISGGASSAGRNKYNNYIDGQQAIKDLNDFGSNVSNITNDLASALLLPATGRNLRHVKGNFSITTSDIANFSHALISAFEILQAYNRSKDLGSQCNQAIMLVTDGSPSSFEEIFQRYNYPNIPVRVFTYLIGREVGDVTYTRLMACQNRGYYTHVANLAEVREQVQQYLPVMARPLVLSDYHPVTWTAAYGDLSYQVLTDWAWENKRRERARQFLTESLKSYEEGTYGSTPISWLSTGDASLDDGAPDVKSLLMERKLNEDDTDSIPSEDELDVFGNTEFDSSSRRPDLLTTIVQPVFDRRNTSVLTERVLVKNVWVDKETTARTAQLLGVAACDLKISQMIGMAPSHKLGANGYAILLTNNGYVMHHPDLRALLEDAYDRQSKLLKPFFASVDLTHVEHIQTQDHTQASDDSRNANANTEEQLYQFDSRLVAMREQIVKRLTGWDTLKTKRSIDNQKRAQTREQSFYYGPIKDTPFSFVIALPYPYGAYRVKGQLDIKRKNITPRLSRPLQSYFKPNNMELWTVHPDYYYCEGQANSSVAIILDVIQRVERGLYDDIMWRTSPNSAPFNSPSKIMCDKDLLMSLLFDAVATYNTPDSCGGSPISSDMESRLLNMYRVDMSFVATRSGLTRVRVYDESNRIKKLAETFISRHPRAIDEPFYSRTVDFNMLINEAATVVAVPFNTHARLKAKLRQRITAQQQRYGFDMTTTFFSPAPQDNIESTEYPTETTTPSSDGSSSTDMTMTSTPLATEQQINSKWNKMSAFEQLDMLVNSSVYVSGTQSIIIGEGKQRAVAGVVGLFYDYSTFAKRFFNITSVRISSASRRSTGSICQSEDGYNTCPTQCGYRNDSIHCFLIDNNGFVVVSEELNHVGRHLSEVDRKLFASLIADGVYHPVKFYDYQGVCIKGEDKNAGAASSQFMHRYVNLTGIFRALFGNIMAIVSWFWSTLVAILFNLMFLTNFKSDNSIYDHYDMARGAADAQSLPMSSRLSLMPNRTTIRPCEKTFTLYETRSTGSKTDNSKGRQDQSLSTYTTNCGCEHWYVYERVVKTNLIMLIVNSDPQCDTSSMFCDLKGDSSHASSSMNNPSVAVPSIRSRQIVNDLEDPKEAVCLRFEREANLFRRRPDTCVTLKMRSPKKTRDSLISDYFPRRVATRAQCGVKSQTQLHSERDKAIRHHLESHTDPAHIESREDPLMIKGLHGVFAIDKISKGSFVCEYAGDLITRREGEKREAFYARKGLGCYMFHFSHNSKAYCLDATKPSGRLGRLVNHSRKAPNCKLETYCIGDTPHLILIAIRDIVCDEEILYDYGERRKQAIKENPWLRDS
ncbi:ABC transporter G family member 23, partial [Fragariocoptes setiger]